MSASFTDYLQPERRDGETFEEYRRRRTGTNRAVKIYMLGQYLHVSANIIEVKDKAGLIHHSVGRGRTYNVGRNAEKLRKRVKSYLTR